MGRFVHLHTHSHYSFLRALPKVEELVDTAKKLEMPALAITDEGNLHAAIEFYKYATKKGVKPIIGVDSYVAPRSRFLKDSVLDAKRSRIVLLAENQKGYQNLLKLVTLSFTEGFFERPRVDRELLEECKEGIIALLPSFAGDAVQLLKDGDGNGARAAVAEWKSIYGPEHFFIELSHHPKADGHQARMKELQTIAEEAGVRTVAQHDVYYLSPKDSEACEVMRRISHGGQSGQNETEDFSFVSEERMRTWFKDNPDAVDASGEIAERCTVSFDLGKWTFPFVPTDPGKTHADMLRERAYAGIATRGMERTPDVVQRIEYELEVIIDKGFAPYFLAVSDLLQHAKKEGILATTRGSAAGSLVSYLTGITTVDPLSYKLPFERFLNPERPKAPDIDMDFADNRRDEMIAYAKKKYGEDKVAQIGTFGTMMARAAVRDVARALGHSYGTGDRIAKLIPMGSQGFPMTIERAMELEEDLRKLYRQDDDVREIIDLAKRIEGCARHTGVHAAGVVIASSPLSEWTPVQYDPKGEGKLITQYDMHSVEDIGLLKFDFLGIKNLAILSDAVERVQETRGIAIDVETVPLDDPKTFAMLARGETEGTFQLNGSGMTRYLKELQPTTIHDINAMVALYRPGPMETIPQYIERKKNPRLITYMDPRMQEYLDFSYGLLVYQDDVLLTAIKLGGYSWLEADTLRKAMGKKIPEEMEAQKEKLITGMVEFGKLRREKAEAIWKLIEPFAAYGFNKCLTGDTRIYDPVSGLQKTIASLAQTRDTVSVASLEENGSFVRSAAKWVRENGVKPVFKLTTRSGRVIRATGNHPLLSFNGWKNLEDLSPGTRIAVPRSLPEPESARSVPEYEATVLGYLLSEGNLCHPHGIYFYSTQENEISDFSHAALRFSNTRVSLNRSKRAISAYVGREHRAKEHGIWVWARELDILGKTAVKKSIPDTVFGWDTPSLAVLVGKMWQGDGTVSLKNQQAFYATSSKQLAHDVQHLLLRFSIISTIHTKRFRYRGTMRPGYTVVVTGAENLNRLDQAIGPHMLGMKRSLLISLARTSTRRTNALGRGTSDTIPAEILATIREEALRAGVTIRELSKRTGLAPRLFSFDARKRGYTRDMLARTAVALRSKLLTSHATSDIFWDEIRDITPDGEEMTYDLTVPKLQNFVANDVVVHNSHAACYGKVAYQTAYMKANYPVEYMAALLTADSGDTDSIAILVAEADRLNIPVLPPDINESRATFTVVLENGAPHSIRFGLSSIKNFGEGISEAIIFERERAGAFTSLSDFLSRVDSKNLNRKSLESLIKCGALDALAKEYGGRRGLLLHIETMLSFHRDATKEASQDSLFGGLMNAPVLSLPKAESDASLSEKLEWERELLGIYVSGHPLDAHGAVSAKASVTIKNIRENPRPGLSIILPLLVSDVRTILTKSGEKMAFVKFEDRTETIEGVMFPKLYKEHGALLMPGKCVLVKATISNRNNELSLALDNIKAL